LSAVGDVELGENVGEVSFHGGAGNEQAVGDAGVGQALSDELCHVPFGGGETVPAVAGTLPPAPAAPGVADCGSGGQLPCLRDGISGLASESLDGPFAISCGRCLVVAVLSHHPVQHAGGDQQAQPFGRACGIYR